MTTDQYIYENDVDINDNESLGFHLQELIAQINKEGRGRERDHPMFPIARDLYNRFKEIQPF